MASPDGRSPSRTRRRPGAAPADTACSTTFTISGLTAAPGRTRPGLDADDVRPGPGGGGGGGGEADGRGVRGDAQLHGLSAGAAGPRHGPVWPARRDQRRPRLLPARVAADAPGGGRPEAGGLADRPEAL